MSPTLQALGQPQRLGGRTARAGSRLRLRLPARPQPAVLRPGAAVAVVPPVLFTQLGRFAVRLIPGAARFAQQSIGKNATLSRCA